VKKAGVVALGLALSAPLLTGASSCSSNGAKQSERPQVEFIVTGSAPSGVHITYGTDASNQQVKRLPLDVRRPVKKHALYWVMAQLQGSGRITCKVVVGSRAKAGHAVGGFNTCTAQSPSDPLGGWN
jgi:hypothetical protein